jgi:simple sugar transport system permease protein
MEYLIAILAAAVRSGTPVLYATLGEIICERAGVMNLGLEGVMLVGAYAGFATAKATGNPWLAFPAAFLAGALLCVLHGLLCLHGHVNQTVSGLAVAMVGTGASTLLGRNVIGQTIPGIGPLPLPGLSKIPVLGPVLFGQDPLVYISFALTALLCFVLFRTRWGLKLRAVGENPRAADAMGIRVNLVRWTAILVGGGLAGIAGGYLSVVYTQMWIEGMTAGRGWIALALVIFGIWHPARAAAGAYLFGGVEALQLRMQAAGSNVPAPLLLMLPYLTTLIVLTVISIRKGRGIALGAPAALGLPFHREERE